MKGIKNPSTPFGAPRFFRPFPLFFLATLTLSQSGCAIRYRDPKTDTEHIWGFAHLKMRVAPVAGSPAPAVATQTETFGLGVHLGSATADSGSGFVFGWDRRTRLLVPDDTALSIEWPGAQLFDVRVGGHPPFLPPTAAPAASPRPASAAPAPAAIPLPPAALSPLSP